MQHLVSDKATLLWKARKFSFRVPYNPVAKALAVVDFIDTVLREAGIRPDGKTPVERVHKVFGVEDRLRIRKRIGTLPGVPGFRDRPDPRRRSVPDRDIEAFHIAREAFQKIFPERPITRSFLNHYLIPITKLSVSDREIAQGAGLTMSDLKFLPERLEALRKSGEPQKLSTYRWVAHDDHGGWEVNEGVVESPFAPGADKGQRTEDQQTSVNGSFSDTNHEGCSNEAINQPNGSKVNPSRLVTDPILPLVRRNSPYKGKPVLIERTKKLAKSHLDGRVGVFHCEKIRGFFVLEVLRQSTGPGDLGYYSIVREVRGRPKAMVHLLDWDDPKPKEPGELRRIANYTKLFRIGGENICADECTWRPLYCRATVNGDACGGSLTLKGKYLVCQTCGATFPHSLVRGFPEAENFLKRSEV